MRKLPPLNALRAFEATARLGGVQKASNELCVTHGAVSRHVKQLEAWLGTDLFDRSERSLKLTTAGDAYRQTLAAALDLIQEGTIRVQNQQSANTLGVATTHSIATKWLMEKLPTFNSQFPDTEVWLSLEQGLTDFRKAGVDVALRMGSGPWPGLECIPLMDDRLIPVCSPQLVSKDHPINSPSDLSAYTLLHDQDTNTQWQRWFDYHRNTLAASGPALDSRPNNLKDLLAGPRFASTDILLSAAMSGQGIALVNELLARNDIASGRLIRPLPEAIELGVYYWIVMPKGNLSEQKVKNFCEWIHSQLK